MLMMLALAVLLFAILCAFDRMLKKRDTRSQTARRLRTEDARRRRMEELRQRHEEEWQLELTEAARWKNANPDFRPLPSTRDDSAVYFFDYDW